MLLTSIFLTALLWPALLAKGPSRSKATVQLNGNYHMILPNDGYQYVFAINWSNDFNRYVVVTVGQPVAWGTATLDMVNDTAVNLIADNGDNVPGVISSNNDTLSICWPTSKDLTCWTRLLSNIKRIHVINM